MLLMLCICVALSQNEGIIWSHHVDVINIGDAL